MTEYFVTFYMKLSAKNEKDLERKAEQVAETMSKQLHKKVEAHGFAELTKVDKIVKGEKKK